MLRKALTLLAIVVVIAILMPACGATATPTTAPTTAPKPTTAQAQSTTAPTAAPTAAPTKAPAQTTFTFCTGGDARRLDPADFDDELSWLPASHIFDTLYVVKDTSGQPKPNLATSYEVSSDLKEWTFHLRQGVKFHDGTPFNADAYLWELNRMWDPNHPYHADQYATLKYYLWVDYSFGLKGDPNAAMQDIQKVDDYTIKFVLKDPNPVFLQMMSGDMGDPVSPTAFQKWGVDFYKHPVGTGPYIFQEWVKDDHITLVKNPDYWNPSEFPLDKIVFKVITDPAARFLAVKAGDCQGMNLVTPDDAVTASKDPNLQVALRPPANVGYIRFNMNVKPLDDKNVRLALAYATNKKSIVDNLYSGMGQVATQWLGPLYPGHNPDVKGYDYDLNKAKEYMKAAGLEKGFTIDYWYMPVSRPYFPNPKAVAEAVSADWAKIGVTLNLKTEDWGQYLLDRTDGKFPIFMMGWTPDYIDGSVLEVWFKDDPVGKGAATKESGFANAEVTDLLKKAFITVDTAERTKMYERVGVIVNDIVPGVPVVHTSVPNIFSAKVKGFVPVPLKTDLLRGVTLTP